MLGVPRTFRKGHAIGYAKGRLETAIALLLRLGGKRFGEPPARIQAQLAAIEDLDHLNELGDLILDAWSWDEFLTSAKHSRPG